jgi:hypothetical protein
MTRQDRIDKFNEIMDREIRVARWSMFFIIIKLIMEISVVVFVSVWIWRWFHK